MEPTIELYEPNHEHLKIKTRRGTKKFVHVVKMGPFIKICPSPMSAARFLEKLGYRYEIVGSEMKWIHKYKSQLEIDLERNYTKS